MIIYENEKFYIDNKIFTDKKSAFEYYVKIYLKK